MEATLIRGKAVERLLYGDNGSRYRTAAEIPFYKLQQKIILKNVGMIDPSGDPTTPSARAATGPWPRP